MILYIVAVLTGERKNISEHMGKKVKSTEKDIQTDKVLMTFQIEESARKQANDKADAAAINLSNFLRHCVYEFIASDEVSKSSKAVQKSVTKAALSVAS